MTMITDWLSQYDWGVWLMDFWELIVERFAADGQLSAAAIMGSAVVAAVLVLSPLWRLSRAAATVIHEMGHAVMARAVGRRVSSIRVHSDTSGVMFSSGAPRGPGVVATMLAGYPGPSVLAMLLAVSLKLEYSGAGLTLYQLVLLAAVMLCSNFVGFLISIAVVVSTGVIWVFGDDWLIAATVSGLAVFYAVAGLRAQVELLRLHLRARREQGLDVSTTDAAQAASSWALSPPSGFWLVVFLASGLIGAATVAEVLIFQLI